MGAVYSGSHGLHGTNIHMSCSIGSWRTRAGEQSTAQRHAYTGPAAAFFPRSFLGGEGFGSFWLARMADTRATAACTTKPVSASCSGTTDEREIEERTYGQM